MDWYSFAYGAGLGLSAGLLVCWVMLKLIGNELKIINSMLKDAIDGVAND